MGEFERLRTGFSTRHTIVVQELKQRVRFYAP